MQHQLPWDLKCSDNWLHNIVASLDSFKGVSIDYERDEQLSDAHGECQGKWRVSVTAANSSGRYRTFESKGEDFKEVLYDAVTQAEKSEDEFYDQRERAREAALAKLTPEEKALLSLR